jgi:hypothetical protein
MARCSKCKGEGLLDCPDPKCSSRDSEPDKRKGDCPVCHRSGKIACLDCGGTGEVLPNRSR